jgi:hypothetical protein
VVFVPTESTPKPSSKPLKVPTREAYPAHFGEQPCELPGKFAQRTLVPSKRT